MWHTGTSSCNLHSQSALADNQCTQPDDLVFDADFFLWPVVAVDDDAAVNVGGGLRGFFALIPSFDAVLSAFLLIVYGSSRELGTHNTHADLHCVQKINTYSHFLSYLNEWCVDLNKNCSEYT